MNIIDEAGEDRHMYRSLGFLHLKDCVSPQFLNHCDEAMASSSAQAGALHNVRSQRASMPFDFPDTDTEEAFLDTVARVTGLDREQLTISDRRIQQCRKDGLSPPHKDPLSAELAVGFPLHSKGESQLILFPDASRRPNLGMTPSLLDEDRMMQPRRNLTPDALSNPLTLNLRPGDMVIYPGHSMLHQRRDVAGSSMLYIKLNASNLDPLGADKRLNGACEASPPLAESLSNAELLNLHVMLSPRLEALLLTYSRLNWRALRQAKLSDKPPLTLSDREFDILYQLDKPRRIDRIHSSMRKRNHEFVAFMRAALRNGLIVQSQESEVHSEISDLPFQIAAR